MSKNNKRKLRKEEEEEESTVLDEESISSEDSERSEDEEMKDDDSLLDFITFNRTEHDHLKRWSRYHRKLLASKIPDVITRAREVHTRLQAVFKAVDELRVATTREELNEDSSDYYNLFDHMGFEMDLAVSAYKFRLRDQKRYHF